jgi:hypothetical protein
MAAGLACAIVVAGLGTNYDESFGAPGGKVFGKERGYIFGEEFRQCIEDDLLKREPHPNAKPLGAFNLRKEILAGELLDR